MSVTVEGATPAAAPPPPEWEYALDKSDPLQIARRFLKARFAHPEHPRLVYAQESWYAWNNRCYVEREGTWLRSELYKWLEHCTARGKGQFVEPFRPTRSDANDAVDALTAVAYTDARSPSWLIGDGEAGLPDPSRLLVGTNGVLDLSDPDAPPRKLTPALFTTNAIDYPIEPSAPEPVNWLAFLETVWPGDEDSKSLLQEWAGYILSAETSHQKILLVLGPTRSGKGTICRILERMVGRSNVCNPTLSGLATNFGLASLIDKRLGMINDARLSNRADMAVITERLLSISGEDGITIDRKNRAAVSMKLPTRLMICTNEMPRLPDASIALVNRFLLLHMKRSFLGKEDPQLTEKLCREIPGILAWAIRGWQRLSERGRFSQPEAGRDAIRELADLSSPVGKFVENWCSTRAEAQITCQRLYAAWRLWCQDEGQRVSPMPFFSRDLHAAVPGLVCRQYRDEDGTRPRKFEGITLTIEADLEVCRRLASRETSPPPPPPSDPAADCPV